MIGRVPTCVTDDTVFGCDNGKSEIRFFCERKRKRIELAEVSADLTDFCGLSNRKKKSEEI